MKRNGKTILIVIAVAIIISAIFYLAINTADTTERKEGYISVAVGESVQLLSAENCTLHVNKLLVSRKDYKDYYGNLSNSQYIILRDDIDKTILEIRVSTSYKPEVCILPDANINLALRYTSSGIFYDFAEKKEHLIHFIEIEDGRYVGDECKLFVKLWVTDNDIAA